MRDLVSEHRRRPGEPNRGHVSAVAASSGTLTAAHSTARAARSWIPEYAPVSLSEQVREIQGQLQRHINSTAWYVRRRRMSEGYAAAELQRLQSALHSLQALEKLLGPDTALTADQLFARLSSLHEATS